MGKRKSYTSQFKSKIVLEILKEERSLVDIPSKHGIHVNQLRQWRKAALDHMPQLFERENKKIDQMKEEGLFGRLSRILRNCALPLYN